MQILMNILFFGKINIIEIIAESLENNNYVNLKNFKESFSIPYLGSLRIETIKFTYEKDGTKFHIEVSRISD